MRAAETDPNEARAVEIIHALRASGWSNQAILAALQKLGVPARDGRSTSAAERRIVADVRAEAETVARILAKREEP